MDGWWMDGWIDGWMDGHIRSCRTAWCFMIVDCAQVQLLWLLLTPKASALRDCGEIHFLVSTIQDTRPEPPRLALTRASCKEIAGFPAVDLRCGTCSGPIPKPR